MKIRHCSLVGTLLLLLAAVVPWATGFQLLPAMTRWLDVGERPQPADYVMVLTGDENTRPFAAAALIESGFAQRALVAGSAGQDDGAILPRTDDVVRQVLLKRGVPETDITVLPGAAATTYDEARALAAFLCNHDNARVIVLTSDFHTRRSRWTFARALADRAGQVSIVSAPVDEFEPERWWRNETGFATIVAEYLKLGFYLTYYSHLGTWLAACSSLTLIAVWARRRQTKPSPCAGEPQGKLTPLQRDG